MNRLVNGLMKNLSGLVLVGGAAAMTAGAGMIYLPAGFLVGGALAIAGAVLSIWGESEGRT